MCVNLSHMEAERLRLHDFASRMGLDHDQTLQQSKLLDRMIVSYMKNTQNQEKGLRLQP